MKEFLQWAMAIIALLFICFLSSLVLTNPQADLTDFVGDQQNPNGASLPVASDLTQCEGAPFIVPTSGWIGKGLGLDLDFSLGQGLGLSLGLVNRWGAATTEHIFGKKPPTKDYKIRVSTPINRTLLN